MIDRSSTLALITALGILASACTGVLNVGSAGVSPAIVAITAENDLGNELPVSPTGASSSGASSSSASASSSSSASTLTTPKVYLAKDDVVTLDIAAVQADQIFLSSNPDCTAVAAAAGARASSALASPNFLDQGWQSFSQGKIEVDLSKLLANAATGLKAVSLKLKRDSNLKESSCYLVTFLVDKIPPTLTSTIAQTSDLTTPGYILSLGELSGGYSFTGNCGEVGQNVTIESTGEDNSSGALSLTRAVSCALATPSASTGTYTALIDLNLWKRGEVFSFKLSQSDLAGNKTTLTRFVEITPNNPPTGNSISIAGGSAYTNQNPVTLTLAATGASEMYITNTSGCASGGVWESYATSKANWTLAQTNATASVYAKFRNTSLIESTCVSDTIIHDNIIPTVAITLPVANSYINLASKASYTVSGTCSEAGQAVVISGAASATTTCQAGHTWSVALDFTLATEGIVTLNINHSDAATNAAIQDSRSFKLDSIAPVLAITAGGAINIANKATYIINGTCVGAEDGQVVTLKVGSTTIASPTCTSGAYSATGIDFSNITNFPEGTINVTADVTDAAGNPATQALRGYTKDVTAPTLSITTPSASTIFNAGAVSSITISGSCSDNGQSVFVSASDSATGLVSTLVIPNCDTSATPRWSTTINVSPLLDGTVTLKANYSDAAGNPATQATVAIIKDTVAPNNPSFTAPSSSQTVVADTYLFSWSTPTDPAPGTGFDHFEYEVYPTTDCSGTPTVSATTTSSTSTTVTLTLRGGTTNVKVKAVDLAGNKSSGTCSNAIINGNPFLVKDINRAVSNTIAAPAVANGYTFFSGVTSAANYGLYKTDTTTGTTTLVKEIPSNFVTITASGNLVFFTASDSTNGYELWASDGTAAGTGIVKDICPGASSSSPQYLTDVNGTFFFRANDCINGQELWKSDGTSSGTVLVKDINPGLGGSNPNFLTNINGTLFFAANDGVHSIELWKSDGTSSGTVLVKDIYSGPSGSIPSYLTNLNGTLFFQANDGTNGTELWKSDGTSAGTILVKDINPGAFSSSPGNLTNVNGTLFFSASDGVSGIELWKSDGTSAGTVLVKDIFTGSADSTPTGLTAANGTLYFYAEDPTLGATFFKSDGTSAGTVPVDSTITVANNYSSPSNLTNVNGILFFAASDTGSSRELWKSDGTSAGTVLVKDINPGTSASNPSNLTNVNGMLFFSADDGVHGPELWKSDGTSSGTVLVKDIFPGASTFAPIWFTNVNGTLFFQACASGTDIELYKSDGTSAGTVMVKDINPGGGASVPAYLTNVNGTLFFQANDGTNGYELWKSDGTSSGTVLVKDISPGASNSAPSALTNVNGTLFFQANDGAHGSELWKSDGTSAGTILVKDINPGASSSSPSNLTNVNGTLFFSASDGVNGIELWKSDGTSSGTVLVKDINPGASGSSLSSLTNVNGTLFFQANDGTNGNELWKSDGTSTGTVLVKDISPGAGGSSPQYLSNVNGTLYFQAFSTGELWKSDGTSAGTVMIKAVKGPLGSYPNNIFNIGNNIYFSAGSYQFGNGLPGGELFMLKP